MVVYGYTGTSIHVKEVFDHSHGRYHLIKLHSAFTFGYVHDNQGRSKEAKTIWAKHFKMCKRTRFRKALANLYHH